MIEFAMTQDGVSVPKKDTSAYVTFLKQQFALLGLTAYSGDPTTNGCPFDFGDFTYTQGSTTSYDSFMLTIVHPEMTDSCIVIAYLAQLTINSFTGGNGSYSYAAVYSRNSDGELVFSRTTIDATLYYYGWRIAGASSVAFRLSRANAVIMGSNIAAIVVNSTLTAYTHNLTPVYVPNIQPSDIYFIAINKPVADYGIAKIGFPSNDVIDSNICELLIQGTYYYPLSNTKPFVCIY